MDNVAVILVGAVCAVAATALSSRVVRALGIKDTVEVETGRVGGQPVIERRRKEWMYLVDIAAVVGGFAGGGYGAILLIRLIQGA